jgi:hypothetical protein
LHRLIQVGQAAFCQAGEGNRQVDIEMLGTLGQHRYLAALSEGMFDLNGNCDRSDLVVGEVSDHDLSANSVKPFTVNRQAPNPCEEKFKRIFPKTRKTPHSHAMVSEGWKPA